MVEVGAVDEAGGVGGEPASGCGVVVALAEVDEAELGIESLGSEAPGTEQDVLRRVLQLLAKSGEVGTAGGSF